MALLLLLMSCKTTHKTDDAQTRSQQWMYDGTGTWKYQHDTLTLVTNGPPTFDIRRPAAMALLPAGMSGRYEVEMDALSHAAADNVHGDILFIFSYQSPSRFYYTHLSGIVDAVHNGVFIVDDADRRRLDPFVDEAIMIDRQWHHYRLVHDTKTGLIEVYRDGSAQPYLRTHDKSFNTGRIGVGSFDDTATFAHVRFRKL